jgi:hypothetical protein
MESSSAAARSRVPLFGALFACSAWDGEADRRSGAGLLRHRILAEICEQPIARVRRVVIAPPSGSGTARERPPFCEDFRHDT